MNTQSNVNELLLELFKASCNEIRNEKWFETLAEWIELTKDLKDKLKDIESDLSEGNVNKCIDEIFKDAEKIRKIKTLDEYLYETLYCRDCGAGNISRGVMSHKDRDNLTKFIKKNLQSFIELYKEKNSIDFYNNLSNLSINAEIQEDYVAVKVRFTRLVFPDDLTPNDPKNRINEICELLKKKLGTDLCGTGNFLEKHKALMDLLNLDECENFECLKDLKDAEKKALKQIFFWNIRYMLSEGDEMKKQTVYYGAPGTGKTYKAKCVAQERLLHWRLRTRKKPQNNLVELVQFHPSFGYEDFIEGIRPDLDGNFKVVDGVFKKFCKKAGKIEIELWLNEAFRDKFKKKSFSEITWGDLDADLKNALKNIKPEISEELLSKMTLEEIIEPAFFIIDEINRAELGKVFGELMYALEYRGYGGKIKTPYASMPRDESDYFFKFKENGEDWFFVPHNVYILATMNTIDRSVDVFDFAMRRRFEWEEVEPDYDVIRNEMKKYGDELAKRLQNLNKKITDEPLLGPDYRVGHAYVLALKNLPTVQSMNAEDITEYLWERSIKPLLEEYLRGITDAESRKKKMGDFRKAFTGN